MSEKVRCLKFYIDTAWDFQGYEEYFSLPEDWENMSPKERDVYIEDNLEDWFYQQVQYGYKMSEAYEDDIQSM